MLGVLDEDKKEEFDNRQDQGVRTEGSMWKGILKKIKFSDKAKIEWKKHDISNKQMVVIGDEVRSNDTDKE